MKNKIIAAALAVTMAMGFYACDGKKTITGTDTDIIATPNDSISQTEMITEQKTTAIPSTTVALSTTKPVTTTQKQVTTTAKKVATTIKKVTTTKKRTTAPETTQAKDEEINLYECRTEEKTYDTKLKYGVRKQTIVTVYYQEQDDGSELIVKEEEVLVRYDRVLYVATYAELLPAAEENRKTYRSKINEVLEIINGYRKDGGLEPLVLNDKLTEIANVRAEEVAWSGDHDHTRPNLTSCFSIIRDNGFSSGLVGENIGWGFESSASVCEAWKNSETHYANIMEPRFTQIGIGIAADPNPDGKLCWVQHFHEG